MTKIILVGAILLLVFAAVIYRPIQHQSANVLSENVSKQPEGLPPLTTRWEFDNFRFVAHEDSPTVWVTDIYIGNSGDKAFSPDGYYLKSEFQNLDQSGVKYLEIILLSGKLGNSKLFKYSGSKLERVLVPKEIWSYFDPEYKDVDGDGIKEMLVYHTPGGAFDRPRTVEVYHFNGGVFQKQLEYEET